MTNGAASVVLLDANVLIARTVDDHAFHHPVQEWMSLERPAYASCPITQGSLVRFLVRVGFTIEDASRSLHAVTDDSAHAFWPDDVGYDRPMLARVQGHGDVTDAYLAQLARHHGGKLATLDRRLGDLHPDVTLVIPT